MFTEEKTIITPDELKEAMPLSDRVAEVKQKNDIVLKEFMAGRDKRFLVVSGPCSADNEDALSEYCGRLSHLADKLSDKILFVTRIFTAKPRTNGEGYLGMMYQPDGKNVDIDKGVRLARQMLMRCISETGLPVADELLYPEYYDYYDDLISYYFIGARSSENPEHRNIGSGLDVVVGVKNSTGGNLISLAGAVHACQNPKTFLLKGKQVSASGNPYAHAVLRGFVDESGVFFPNYSENSLKTYEMLCGSMGVINNSVIIDCSHANSAKQSMKQIQAAKRIVERRYPIVKGIMLESYLFEGQSDSQYGVSRTDSCLGWEDTEELLYDIYNKL